MRGFIRRAAKTLAGTARSGAQAALSGVLSTLFGLHLPILLVEKVLPDDTLSGPEEAP